ncbi:alkyl hydroperoxide reductase subunit F [Defluviitalea phaphyphila]|uniref:alkyl hydroperoxide reductase subunit F n=1 Tax=Defluviitalea phaphyphila TaxID=1473580 RepID=UPI000ACDBB6F|nr:alkyl hydroperoxide reductase subunit F [Defluviitalea phaphyphila]
MLDQNIKNQLSQYLQLMENEILIKVDAGSDKYSKDMMSLINEIALISPKIKIEKTSLSRTPSFSINHINEDTGVVFAGIPLGHEFNSFVLALLQVSGRPPKIDKKLISQIKNLKGKYHFETYVSLSCHNCPEVVQALNIMSILNPNITHTMIDGAIFKKEVESKDILAVPTVYLNGEFFTSGRMTLEEILSKLGSTINVSELNNNPPFDVLVIGGGPSGASAAIYAARKGIRTGIIAKRFGGQILDTLGIENFISVKYIEGPTLASNIKDHLQNYDIDIINSQQVKSLKRKDFIEVELENGAILKSKTVIIATGARWRNIGVPGEMEFKNKGVAYCPHCDAPLFKGKNVAVIGGGNSGIEAAIDLAGIAKHVTVLEFMPQLKADSILQEKLNSLPNINVLTNVEVKEITGDNKVNGIVYVDRNNKKENHIKLDGVFIQIGLVPNTDWLKDIVKCNEAGEIIVDKYGATNVPGIFAAGDCTNAPYKQIIISMGSGATAALSAFNYLMKN